MIEDYIEGNIKIIKFCSMFINEVLVKLVQKGIITEQEGAEIQQKSLKQLE